MSLALYVIFPYLFYYLVKVRKGIYNTDRYIPHEIDILHICYNTLFLCYNIRNLNLFLYIYIPTGNQMCTLQYQNFMLILTIGYEHEMTWNR